MTQDSQAISQALMAWKRIVGEHAVLHGPALPAALPACTTGISREVPAVIRVTRDADDEPDEQYITHKILPILRVAAEFGISVHPISTGRNWGYGSWLPTVDRCIVLDLGGIRRIRHFDAELGIVAIEPGVTQAQLSRFLLENNHPYLVPVTGAGPHCSLLGNALERGYGITPISDHFASVLSLEAVLADGTRYRSPMEELASANAAPAYKWGVGSYLDGLFTQSGMGVVTAMRLALARRPASSQVFVAAIAPGTSIDSVVTGVQRIKATLPGLVGGINIVNARRALAMTAPYPREQLGDDGMIPASVLAALQKQYGITEWTLFGTLYGTRRTTAAARRDIRRCLAGTGIRPRFFAASQLHTLESLCAKLPLARFQTAVTRRLRMLRTAAELAEGFPNETALPLAYWRNRAPPADPQALDPARDGCGLIWYAPLLPMRAASAKAFVQFVTATMTKHAMEPLITLTTVNEHCFDASIPLLFDASLPDQAGRAQACYNELMQKGIELGFIPYRLPLHAMTLLEGYKLSHGDLSRRLKQALDPQDLLSPGRYCAPYSAPST